MTELVGIPLYLVAVDLAGQLTSGVFIAAIGVLLILSGALHLGSESVKTGGRERPTLIDPLLVGGSKASRSCPVSPNQA